MASWLIKHLYFQFHTLCPTTFLHSLCVVGPVLNIGVDGVPRSHASLDFGSESFWEPFLLIL